MCIPLSICSKRRGRPNAHLAWFHGRSASSAGVSHLTHSPSPAHYRPSFSAAGPRYRSSDPLFTPLVPFVCLSLPSSSFSSITSLLLYPSLSISLLTMSLTSNAETFFSPAKPLVTVDKMTSLGGSNVHTHRFSSLAILGIAFAILNSWVAMSASLSVVLVSDGSVAMI